MHNWFETTIKYEKTAEEGKVVKVTEKHLVDALSFTEAEARIIEQMRPFISGEFTVTHIRRARINELFENAEGDKWYKGKVVFISLDEEKGISKRTACTMYAQATSVKDAERVITEGMKGTMADYEIEAVTETKIEAVFKYVAE